jgi:hypothetical protein
MVVITESDRDDMLVDAGVTVTVGVNTFTGLFRNDYIESQDIESDAPVIRCKQTDVDSYSITNGTDLTVGGVDYKVIRPEKDNSTGFILLILEEQ